MQDGMIEYKAEGSKFLVEMKNDQGDYEFLGVLSFPEATRLQFTAHRAVRMQRVSDLDEREGELVGHQLFTRGELNMAINSLIDCIKRDTGFDGNLALLDLRNGYSITENRDLCENEWCNSGMTIDFESALRALEEPDKVITEGNLEVYYNDKETDSAFPENHGICIKDGRIYKVY
jgi:hypothetical protein